MSITILFIVTWVVFSLFNIECTIKSEAIHPIRQTSNPYNATLPVCIVHLSADFLLGGGTQIWFGRGYAAEASEPIPMLRGHFWGKK